MYPAWLNVQIEKLALEHSEDLGIKKANAMAHCWANMWIMGTSYPELVHDIIDNWEEPTYPEWKDDWSDHSAKLLDSSSDEILQFKILSNERKDELQDTCKTSTPPPPPPPTDPSLDYFLQGTRSPYSPQPSKMRRDKRPKKKRSGKKNWKKKKKKPSAVLPEPSAFFGKEHNSSQSVTPEKACHPVTTCYSFAQKLRKELTFKELEGSSVSGSPMNERRTVLYLEKRRLCEAKGGNKKARKLECATQAIPTLSKLLAEKAKKRGKSRKQTQSPSDEKVYQQDCDLMTALDIQEKPSRQIDLEEPAKKRGANIRMQQHTPDKNLPRKRSTKRRKAPRSSRASLDLLHAWAKHSKMKLKFLQNKENSKVKLGEEIKVSVWLSGKKIGEGTHMLGDTYQAKLFAAVDAVKWLERKSETFKQFKNSRHDKLMGKKGKTAKKQSTPKPAKSRKKGHKPSPKKVDSSSLDSGIPYKKKSTSPQSINPSTKGKRAKRRDRYSGKKDSPRRRPDSGKKGSGSTSRKKRSSEDLGNVFTEEGKSNKPMRSPKKDEPNYRGGDL